MSSKAGDGRPADQPGTLFGDPTAVHMSVGLVVLRRQTGPAGQLLGAGEPDDVADLGDEHRTQGRPHTGDGEYRPVPGVADQIAPHNAGEHVDLELQRADHPAQRGDPGRVRGRQRHPVQQLVTGHPEQVGHRYLHTALGQHGVNLGLAVATESDKLRPMPDQLTQLTGRRRRDPRLRQAAHPQQVGQIGGVTLVVLHPPVLERLHPQRVRQMNLRAEFLQGIRRPIPAVGGLQHDLRGLAGPGHHLAQPVDPVHDAHAFQHVTAFRGANDHRPSTVQIDTHELLTHIRFAHKGPPSS